MRKWILLGLLAACFTFDHGPRHFFSTELASVANPLTEFSDFDELIVNWTRILSPSHDAHQVHWLEILEAAHCEGIPDQEMMWLEGSREYNWEPTQKIEIPEYSHSYETRVSGKLINEATIALSAQMQVHGCLPQNIQFELQIVSKFKSATSSEQIPIEPERILINRSSNINLQTGNVHPLQNGIGVWTLSRGS